MSVLHRTRMRLIVCCAVATTALGVLAFAPAANAARRHVSRARRFTRLRISSSQVLRRVPKRQPGNVRRRLCRRLRRHAESHRPEPAVHQRRLPGGDHGSLYQRLRRARLLRIAPTSPKKLRSRPNSCTMSTTPRSSPNALSILKENPNVNPITLDIGSNDLLQFLANTCGFPKEDKCTEAEIAAEGGHIVANVGSILATLHAAAPHAQIVYVAAYNPYPGFPTPGGDLALAQLNAALGQRRRIGAQGDLRQHRAAVQPVGTFGGPESGDVPRSAPTPRCAPAARSTGRVRSRHPPHQARLRSDGGCRDAPLPFLDFSRNSEHSGGIGPRCGSQSSTRRSPCRKARCSTAKTSSI